MRRAGTIALACALWAAVPAHATLIVEYTTPTASSQPGAITAGPDGNLWFTEYQANRLGIADTSGAIGELTPLPNAGSQPLDIARGPDDNLWFTEASDRIGRIGVTGSLVEFPVAAGTLPFFIAA